MAPRPPAPSGAPTHPKYPPGVVLGDDQALATRAGTLGRRLAQAFGALHRELFAARVGPKRAADVLGQPVPMASRVLAALGEADPIALVHRLPGPDPLRRWVRAAGRKGAPVAAVQGALQAIDAFDELITAEGGDRGAFDAQLVAWLPEARRTLELRRRQAVFRGLSELEGISCHLDLSSIILHPSRNGRHVDLLCIQARTGIVALRPGLRTKFVTERVTAPALPQDRQPVTLDGVNPFEAPAGVRLDEYCVAPPAQLEVAQHSDRIQYILSTHGHGPNAEVDFVIAELNPAEFERSDEPRSGGSFFTQLTLTPTRLGVLDVILHADLAPSALPQVFHYRNIGEYQARPMDPAREVDRIEPTEAPRYSRGDVAGLRLAGLPRYGELLADVFTRLGWRQDGAHHYRAECAYPVPGTQVSLLFEGTQF
jgi:hypothetical protein